jgi:serine/threonine protein kinase
MLAFTCPCCHTSSSIGQELAGRPFRCPSCGQPCLIPSAGPAQATSINSSGLDGERPTLLPTAGTSSSTLPVSPSLDNVTAVEIDTVPGYEILEELGRGGMGVVYKARQIGLNRLCALKMILAGNQAGASDLARFQIEAEALARLQHPNIITVYEVGQHQGKPYFSLEFCAEGSLDRKLSGVPFKPARAAKLVRTLAEAMHAAHMANVIHRDLKPANVLLAACGLAGHSSDHTPKITDFGLAKCMDIVGQTRTGAVMGTPSYMAPEQAEGKKEVGPAADVYGLGAILYECLVGRPPFKAATAYDTIMQVISDEPVPPRQLNANVPRDLETICLKCLEKDPTKRFSSAAALAEDLQRFLEGKPVLARPLPAWEQCLKWVKRRPVAASLFVAGNLLLLGGLLLGLVYAGQLRRHNEELTAALQTAEERRMDAELEKDLANQNEAEARRQQKAVDEHRSKLLLNNHQLALLLKSTGQHQKAEEIYRQNLKAQRKLAATFPDQPNYQHELARTLDGLARCLLDRARSEEARPLLERAIECQKAALQRQPRDAKYLDSLRDHYQQLAETLLRLKDHAACAQIASERAQQFPQSGEDLIASAAAITGCLALAEKDDRLSPAKRARLAHGYEDKAVGLVQTAVKAGYKDAGGLRKDDRFAALRGRAAFEKLVKELEAK